jgi:ABC-type Mn2+/Zn2+ transport system ATPase subunit
MIMRNLRPVIVFIDSQSFGSDLSGAEVIQRLKQRGVPVVVVSHDIDLKEALESTSWIS